MLTLERAARDPDTWLPPRRREVRRRTPQVVDLRPPTVPPSRTDGGGLPRSAPPRHTHSASAAGGNGEAVTVRRWRRFGRDRFYANAPDGTRLGYIEVTTGEVELRVADPRGVIAAQLRAARRAVGRDRLGERAG